MRAALFLVWGFLVLATLGTAQYRGWSMTSASMSKTNPRSVRDNPGSYRSPYFIAGRTLRGK